MKPIYKIGIGILIVLLLALATQTNVAKKLYKRMISDYTEVDKNIVHKIDSLESLRNREYNNYLDILKQRENDILLINKQLEKANQKIRQNEKLLNEYRSGNFDERFIKFSKLITGKDTLSK